MPGPLGISWSCTHTLTKSKPFNINMYLQNCGISLYVYIDHDDCNCTARAFIWIKQLTKTVLSEYHITKKIASTWVQYFIHNMVSYNVKVFFSL